MTPKIASISAIVLISAEPVLAQSATEPYSAQPASTDYVAQSPTILASTYNWTGFYAGAELGYAGVDTSLSGTDGDAWIGGLILGYDYDFGNWVLGGGFDYDWTDVSLGSGLTVDDIWRLKVRAGYKLNDGLLYGVGGYAEARTNNLGSDDGWFIGAGYEHVVTETVSVAGEFLYHEFNNFNGSGVDLDATTFQIRAAYRF